MARRDLEAADITAIYNLHARAAVDWVNRSGREFTPQLVTVDMEDEPGEIGSMLIIDPELTGLLHMTQGAKALMFIVKQLLQSPNSDSPDAVVHVAEGFVLNRQSKHIGGDCVDLDGHASVKDHPERIEALVVYVHTRDGTHQGWCPIEPAANGMKRRATYHPMQSGRILFGRLCITPEHETQH